MTDTYTHFSLFNCNTCQHFLFICANEGYAGTWKCEQYLPHLLLQGKGLCFIEQDMTSTQPGRRESCIRSVLLLMEGFPTSQLSQFPQRVSSMLSGLSLQTGFRWLSALLVERDISLCGTKIY